MENRSWNFLLFTSFAIILSLILFGGSYYKDEKSKDYYHSLYNELTVSMIKKVKTLISEKENATLTISLSQSKNSGILDALQNNTNAQHFLQELSLELRKETDFKNVWFQIINKEGISIARSWTQRSGENLSLVREDVRAMKNKPDIKTSISVGLFDLSFKAMVPVYSKKGEYLGIFETITHFNSIAKKVSEEGFSAVVLLDKKYKKQIKHPFSKLFVGDHYVANNNAEQKYLELIALDGLDSFISPTSNYVVDANSKNIVVNYTLFDSSNLPMANFLMFKPLDKIDMSTIKNMYSIVNLFMLFGTVVLIFIFLFLFKQEINTQNIESGKIQYIFGFALLFTFLSLLYYQFLYWNYEEKEESYLKNYNKNISTDYYIVYQKFNTLAETMYEITLNTKEVKDILRNAYFSEELKNISRKQLFNLLIGKYEFLKELNLRQLHFHLKDNESFLRFHRPQKYGDNLTGVRETVEWVNKNYQSISGFEEGRIYNGFRNVFPLSYQDHQTGKKYHLGSVETSFSPYAIINEFIKSHNVKANFIISSKVVDMKVFNDEQSNYQTSEFADFYYEKTIEKQLKHAVKQIDIENIRLEDIKNANDKIFEGEIFSIVSKDKKSLFTFIPIKNPISNKIVAAIILQLDDIVLKEQKENFFFLLFIGISSLAIIVLFMYREYSSKRKLSEISLKTRQILDTQDSIVITTDSRKLLDANKRFLNFFGYENLLDFKKDYGCICDRFENAEGYFYKNEEHNTQNWIEILKEMPTKERIVLMKDSEGAKHSFSVSFSDFGKDGYIVTFTDMTQTIEERFKLEKKVMQDKLTGVYNREFFDNNIHLLIESAHNSQNKLGLILFDIDHFKNVNDVYGHNRGDAVLKEVSACVESSVRKDDYIIRWGGEEFIVVFYVNSLAESKRMAEHLRSRIENHRFEEVDNITCSFGAIVVDSDEDIVKNIERADKALYEAKNSGRNRVSLG